jgi:hypothetical protein
MAYHHLQCLSVTLMLAVLTASMLFPHLPFDPWTALVRRLRRFRSERRARKSVLIEQRMKKYWVIDMRKLR